METAYKTIILEMVHDNTAMKNRPYVVSKGNLFNVNSIQIRKDQKWNNIVYQNMY